MDEGGPGRGHPCHLDTFLVVFFFFFFFFFSTFCINFDIVELLLIDKNKGLGVYPFRVLVERGQFT